jgi:SAM-dependent methyltransferase
MTVPVPDPFAPLKAVQREAWSLFLPMEVHTTIPAARLVKFARVVRGDRVLDVACGTGVAAITAARAGAEACGLDLSPVLLERARQNTSIARVAVDFTEGDAEALPYPDASFDVVLSEFGHIFAPRPALVTAEMLRVLKPGGRIAFSVWAAEAFVGRFFGVMAGYAPPPAAGAQAPASPAQWGNPDVVRERLGAAVRDLAFERELMAQPSLSPQHTRVLQEGTIGPLAKLVASLATQPERLAAFRAELEALIGEYFEDNAVRQHFTMARATKV